MPEAFINGDILRWARERELIDEERLGKRVGGDANDVAEWEAGTARPTLVQAKALARTLNIPLGYLYLNARPLGGLALPDLRTIGDDEVLAPSPNLAFVVNDALNKQDWYREYLEEMGCEPLPFVGRFSLDDDPYVIAEAIRTAFGIDADLRKSASDWENFLTKFVRRCESQGVIVLRSGVAGSNTRRALEVDEFRGFAISDSMAPLVFINSKDAKAAQVFTLAHEVAHLWIGQSGVSNPDYAQKSSEQQNRIEKLANQVAAEVLVPAEDFLPRWDKTAPVTTNIRPLTWHYRVSRFVILRRAFDLGLIDEDAFWTYYTIFINDKQNGGSTGGDYYATFFARNSTTLSGAIVASMEQGTLTRREAARLLKTSIKLLPTVADIVHSGVAA